MADNSKPFRFGSTFAERAAAREAEAKRISGDDEVEDKAVTASESKTPRAKKKS